MLLDLMTGLAGVYGVPGRVAVLGLVGVSVAVLASLSITVTWLTLGVIPARAFFLQRKILLKPPGSGKYLQFLPGDDGVILSWSGRNEVVNVSLVVLE